MEKMNVLIVDDDLMVVKSIERILSNYKNLKIHIATTVCSAIKHIMDFDPEVIFCDLYLGKLNADDLYRTVMRYNIDERFIFISSNNENDLDPSLLQTVKNKCFLTKPFSPIEIKQQFEKGLIRHST